MGEYVTLGKLSHSLLFKQEAVTAVAAVAVAAVAAQSYCHILFPIAFLEEGFIRNVIIMQRIIISAFYNNNNNNNAIISNNCGGLKDLILLFKIPVGMQKNFFFFSKCVENLDARLQKGSLALV
jgi:hypothetical protein